MANANNGKSISETKSDIVEQQQVQCDPLYVYQELKKVLIDVGQWEKRLTEPMEIWQWMRTNCMDNNFAEDTINQVESLYRKELPSPKPVAPKMILPTIRIAPRPIKALPPQAYVKPTPKPIASQIQDVKEQIATIAQIPASTFTRPDEPVNYSGADQNTKDKIEQAVTKGVEFGEQHLELEHAHNQPSINNENTEATKIDPGLNQNNVPTPISPLLVASHELAVIEQITSLVPIIRDAIIGGEPNFFTRNTGEHLERALRDWFTQAVRQPQFQGISPFIDEIVGRFVADQTLEAIGANRHNVPPTVPPVVPPTVPPVVPPPNLEVIGNEPTPMSPEIRKIFNEILRMSTDRNWANLLILLAKEKLIIFDEKDNCAVWDQERLLWKLGGKSQIKKITADLINTFVKDRIVEIQISELSDAEKKKRLYTLTGFEYDKGNKKDVESIITFARSDLMKGSAKFRSKLDHNRKLIAIRPKHVIECKIIQHDGRKEFVWEIRLRKQEDYLTKEVDFDYDPELRSDPLLDKFLDDFFLGNEQRRNYLLEIFANGFLGNPLQIYLWIQGLGSSGKSSLCNLFINCFNQYAKGSNRSAFVSGKARPAVSETGLTPQLMDLEGYRWTFVPDIQAIEFVIHSSLNQFAGGDVITARTLNAGMNDISCLPMVTFTANNPPSYKQIGSPGLIRKLQYYQCQVAFRDVVTKNPAMLYDPTKLFHRKRDPLMKEMVEHPSDRVKNCLLNIILDATKRLVERNFTLDTPEDLGTMTSSLVGEADIVDVWLNESYEADPNGKNLARDLLRDFKMWLLDNRYTCDTDYGASTFGKKLTDLGIGSTSIRNMNHYHLKQKAPVATTLFPL